ncbi:hypothetical protein C8F04DRAFT_708161 [Mycena alexandri]|uniref:F-box domain-containing protein n=1 Tax=Mycena alexandri TaxID=1745969 RepID=A0AAD6SQ77_9AGAR|nr:hypothetical protein C8F04DRAFT_708161 [Mycena alexandri]
MDTNQTRRDRLAQIEAQIVLLEAERKSIQKKLHSLTYPVLSLPFEITSEIFARCLPDACTAENIPSSKHDQPPTAFILTQICRNWRQVALDTPRLWATFRVSLDDWSSIPDLRRRFMEWVGRAKTSPLSFTLHRTSSSDLPSPTIFTPILDLSMQWWDVDLQIPSNVLIMEQFQSHLYGRLPNLQRLRLKTEERIAALVTAFEHAPSLRRVVLERQPRLILLPWRQLTHFTGGDFSGKDCLHVLQSALSLVECKFVGVQGFVDSPLLPHPHLALKVLHLKGYDACATLLGILTLPSLVELSYDDGNASGFKEEFLAFLSHSHPPLQRLSLPSAYQLLLHSASSLPQLAELTVSLQSGDVSDLLDRMRVASFLPNLQSLVLSAWEPTFWSVIQNPGPINYGRLLEVLNCRWSTNQPGPRFRSFQMTWSPDDVHRDKPEENKLLLIPPPDFRLSLLSMLDLVEQGMRISVVVRAGHAEKTWI